MSGARQASHRSVAKARSIPSVLTVAGSDSGGGAGIQADLKTFAALEVYGLSAVTAVTAQSTVEWRGAHWVPADLVELQIDTVLDDFDVRVLKTGMLGSAETAAVVVRAIDARGLLAVVDPVMIAESGAVLLSPPAVSILAAELLPRAFVFTPNLPEVEALLAHLPASRDEMVDAARVLLERGPRAVLVKGGHLNPASKSDRLADVLATKEGSVVHLESERIETTATHGTGCTYSAAIAAFLARGATTIEAVTRAHRYVHASIAAGVSAPALGRGRGPLHHLHAFYRWPGGQR